MEISIGGIIGLYGGLICGTLGWWFGRQKARKNRGLDELYEHIWQKARSFSWYITLATIYVLFSLVGFGIELNSAMVLGILLFSHLGGWAVIGITLTFNMSGSELLQPSRVKFGLIGIATSIILFTALSVITDNWKFLLWSIPPNLFGLYSILISKKKRD
jgi:hypothetical protein